MSLPLDVALKQCVRHADIMLAALREMPASLSAEQLQHASPELIRLIDQFVLRFTKLQDTLGTHVLRQFAARALAEPVEDLPFIDVLDLLERRGYLTTEAWALQRSTRNALTHEYPDDPQRQALALDAARQAAQQLNQWLEKISLKMT